MWIIDCKRCKYRYIGNIKIFLFCDETVEVLQWYDHTRGVHISHQGGVLALPRCWEVRGAGDDTTAQAECSHPETTVLHRVTEMLKYFSY